MMTHDEFRAWSLKQLEEHMKRGMPVARIVRQLKAGQRESRKSLARARRSLAAQQASSKRKLDQRLAELERASRERGAAQDAELERRRWDLLLGQGRPGV